ncbi:MAG: hypothetical protein Q4C70_03590 [Planctomycetia bacterium]|nr:hypothetical protein [Planctomycetia bacterium]
MKYSTELKWYVILDKSDAEYAHLEQWLKKPRVWTPSIVSYAPTGWKISTDKYTLQVMKDLVVMNKRSGGQYTCKSDEEIVEIMRQLEKNVQNPSEK